MDQKPTYFRTMDRNSYSSLFSIRQIFPIEIEIQNPTKLSQLETAKKVKLKQEVQRRTTRTLIIRSFREFRVEMLIIIHWCQNFGDFLCTYCIEFEPVSMFWSEQKFTFRRPYTSSLSKPKF